MPTQAELGWGTPKVRVEECEALGWATRRSIGLALINWIYGGINSVICDKAGSHQLSTALEN